MDQLEVVGEIERWAWADDNIRMVVLTGSVARDAHDVLSDVDVELFARDPASLLEDSGWYATFGEVLAVEELPNPGWHPTRLIYLVDGKIDFAIGASPMSERRATPGPSGCSSTRTTSPTPCRAPTQRHEFRPQRRSSASASTGSPRQC